MSRWMETGCRSRVWRPRPTSTTRSFSSACSWLPSGSWPASGRCSRTKGMTPRVIALSAATSGSSPRSTRVGSHTDRDWASAAGQSSAATPGCLRTSAWPSAMIGLGSSSNRCCRAHAYSWLQDASPENSENRLLGYAHAPEAWRARQVRCERRAVMRLLEDEEWRGWSDSDLGRRAAVSHDFVRRIRASLASDASEGELPAERTYKTKHGTTARMNT